MKSQPLWLSAFAVCGAMFMSVGSGCKDDGEVNNEPPLPGVGPIGLGGSSSTGGAGGTAGTAGTAGMAGTGGAGAGGGTGGAGAGGAGAGGAGAGGAGAGGSTGGSGGGAAVCPTFGGDANIRVGNLVPAATTLDFCIKGPGKADFEGPVFKCAAGAALQYKQISKSFAVPAGAYEVRSVTGADCSGTHASASVTLAAGESFVVVGFGGGATGETAKVGGFKNQAPPTDGNLFLRFIHGIHKAFPLDVGLTDAPKLPAKVSPAVFANAPFGGIGLDANSGFPVGPTGYAGNVVPLDPIAVGASKAGTDTAIFAANVSLVPANSSLTAYGVGVLGDATFPAGAIICNDFKDDGMFNSCVTPQLRVRARHSAATATSASTPECRDRTPHRGSRPGTSGFLPLLPPSDHRTVAPLLVRA